MRVWLWDISDRLPLCNASGSPPISHILGQVYIISSLEFVHVFSNGLLLNVSFSLNGKA